MGFLDGISNMATGFINEVEGAGNEVMDGAKAAGSAVIHKAEQVGGEVVHGVEALFNSASSEVGGLIHGAESFASSAAQHASESLVDILTGRNSQGAHGSAPAGYAAQHGSTSPAAGDTFVPPSMDYNTSMYVLQQSFDRFDTAAGGAKDGLVSKDDLKAILADPQTTSQMKAAAQFLLQGPTEFNQAETAQNGGKTDGLIGKGDVQAALAKAGYTGLLGMINETATLGVNAAKAGAQWDSHTATAAKSPAPAPAAKTVHGSAPIAKPASPKPATANAGAAASASATKPGTTAGAASSASTDFASALATIQQNFELLDTAAGIGGQDGVIGKVDLQAILNNPGVPTEVKSAAQFLLNNPAYLNELDVAAGKGNVDGLFSKDDLGALLGKIQSSGAKPAASADSSAPATVTKTEGSGAKAKSDKVGGSDKKAASTSKSNASSKDSGVVSAKGDGTAEGTLEGMAQDAAGQLDDLFKQLDNKDLSESDLQTIQLKISHLNEVMTMVTNMEKELHDMRMSIINNIR